MIFIQNMLWKVLVKMILKYKQAQTLFTQQINIIFARILLILKMESSISIM